MSAARVSSRLRLHFQYPIYPMAMFFHSFFLFSFSVRFDFTHWFVFSLRRFGSVQNRYGLNMEYGCTHLLRKWYHRLLCSQFAFKCTLCYLSVSHFHHIDRYTCPVNVIQYVLGDYIALSKVKQSKQFTKHSEDALPCRKVRFGPRLCVGVCVRSM